GLAQIFPALAERQIPGRADYGVMLAGGAVFRPVAGHVVGVLCIRVVVDVVRPGPVRMEGRKARAALRLELKRIVARLAIRTEFGDADYLWIRPPGVGECRRRRLWLADVQGIIL